MSEITFEQKEHTLADFVRESMKVGVSVFGLPDEIKTDQAAQKFGEMTNIQLKPYPLNATYFGGGWFPRPVRKADDNTVLFNITANHGGFCLQVLIPAIELLRSV